MHLTAGLISGALHGLVADWFRNLVTLASFVLSGLAFRQGRPRVRVSQHVASIVASPDDPPSKWAGRAVILITATNDSPRPVVFQSVTLNFSNGPVLPGEAAPGTPGGALPEFGGKAIWFVDYADVRKAARSDGGDDDVSCRAAVHSGRRTFKSRDVTWVHPLAPQMQPRRHWTPRRAFITWRSNWFVPRVQIDMRIPPEHIDVDERSVLVGVHNHGGGVARGVRLELLKSSDDDTRHRVEGVDTVPVSWLRKGQVRHIRVPLTDVGDAYWWVRHKGRTMTGSKAMTLAEAVTSARGTNRANTGDGPAPTDEAAPR